MSAGDVAPRITSLSWGRIEVEGEREGSTLSFKDAKLFPGGAREWDWNETGTRHTPGIQPADIEELLAHGAEVVVLSRGVYQRLQVSPETVRWLEGRGVAAHVLPTEEAIRLYNELRKVRKVGGLFHSTC